MMRTWDLFAVSSHSVIINLIWWARVRVGCGLGLMLLLWIDSCLSEIRVTVSLGL